MKLLSVAGLLAVLLCFASCKKDDDNNTPSTPTAVNNALISGSWKITYYFDRDHEETSNYAAYSFTFATGNVVTATTSAGTDTGTWTTGTDDSKVKLVLVFGGGDPLEELNEDWEVLESTSTKIRLQHVSGGDGHTDLLTFEKK